MTDPFDAGLAPIVYRIDERDEIAFVNDAWRSFAHANDAPAVAEVIGQSLWTSITGAETATLWREVLARVRAGAGFSLPYRCDAPGRRRTLRMQLKPLPHGGVEFVSTLIRADDRDLSRCSRPTTAGESRSVPAVGADASMPAASSRSRWRSHV